MPNNKKLTSWNEYINDSLKDPCEAIAYLELALEEGASPSFNP